MATADLDGNGTADVVVADNLSNTIHAFLNDGTGTFEQGMPDFSISTTFESGHVELADLNGDGLPTSSSPTTRPA